MKIQFAIVHFYNAKGGGKHGSLSPNSKGRTECLREVILQIHRLYTGPNGVLNHLKRRVEVLDLKESQVDIKICTTGGMHLLGSLKDLKDKGAFKESVYEIKDPKYLGFCCHQELAKITTNMTIVAN